MINNPDFVLIVIIKPMYLREPIQLTVTTRRYASIQTKDRRLITLEFYYHVLNTASYNYSSIHNDSSSIALHYGAPH